MSVKRWVHVGGFESPAIAGTYVLASDYDSLIAAASEAEKALEWMTEQAIDWMDSARAARAQIFGDRDGVNYDKFTVYTRRDAALVRLREFTGDDR